MCVAAIDTAPAKVIGKPGCLRPLHQALEPGQVLTIQRFSRAEVHGDSVLHHTVLLENLVERL